METVLAVAAGVALGVLLGRAWSRRGLTPGGRADVAAQVSEALQAERAGDIAAGARLDARIEAVTDGVARLDAALHEVERRRSTQHGDLARSLAHTLDVTTRLSATTADLRRVLSGDGSRGRLGERMAEDVLRAAGLVPGVHYVRQRRSEHGGVPDLTILLPERRCLPVDVKFPLAAWRRAVEASDPAEATRHRRTFLRDVRARVEEVADRSYVDDPGSVGFALLFLPTEAVLSVIVEHEPGLLDDAVARGVVVCSPLTLFAVLAVVREALDRVELVGAASEIRAALASLERRWAEAAGDLDRLGTHLRNAVKAHDELSGARRRRLEESLSAATRTLPVGHAASTADGGVATSPGRAGSRGPEADR